jgi:hypothetical protein
MKALTAALIGASWLGAAAFAETLNFDDATVGKAPPDWTATQTGAGKAQWTIEKDDSAPSSSHVLKQSGVATYPICLKNATQLINGFVEMKFKTLAGQEDQAGGVIWRAQDADNYYVARANALEDNITVYHTVHGKRTEKNHVAIKVTPNEWHRLRVDFEGTQFTIGFDGQTVLHWEDATFSKGGRVGLWTKADSVTVFDDFSYGTR